MMPDHNPPCGLGSTTEQNWYAIYVRPSHEAQVAKRFSIREIEYYLPQYEVEHRWKNRCTRKLDLPLFPGYIFGHITPPERVRVLEVPSVLCVVGTAGRPTPLAASEIEAMRSGFEARNALPHPFLKVGERARIRRGALAGMEGVILRNKNSVRVVISLDLILQSVSVEVDWDELEPITASSAFVIRPMNGHAVSLPVHGGMAALF
jgi:transcription antitermination factor NusG